MNGTSDGYSFTQDNYNTGKSGSGHKLTGDITQGDIRYDTATVNAEYPWKMPTRTQCEELIDNTTYQWTSINGVNCGKFTNKSDSSKYIFIPICGYWDNTSHNNAGARGYYWSTDRYDSTRAQNMNFVSSSAYMNKYYRYYGYSVRPIRYLYQ